MQNENEEQNSFLGSELLGSAVRFRVWAPLANEVHVVVEDGSGKTLCLEPEGSTGYFSGTLHGAGAGLRYRYRLDERGTFPDPCSRFQPEGPHGPSVVVDQNAYVWRDGSWRGVDIKGQVFYEMHIGAFTPEGTFDSATRELPYLAKLGITCIEIMPIAEFPGAFNWGYDGVDLYAPYHGYGDYDAFKRFVDKAHELGLGVILDVVYNHLGADGNFLQQYSRDYFTDRYPNEWGDAINFDGPSSGPVRQFFIGNATYWIREFHLDGLRLDATQSLFDSSQPHVITEIVRCAREAAKPRRIIIVAENEPQQAGLLKPIDEGGFGVDAIWNDDFHHSARVALTGRHEGYFHDYRGRAQEFVSALKYGFLYQGQHYFWQKKNRGSPALHCPAWSFVAYLQNHDQVGNTFYGIRLHEVTSAGRLRAMTAVLLLGPHTPLLFMGQELAASSPFPFFANHKPELAKAVWAGRKEFLKQFAQYATPEAQARVLDPAAPDTFKRAKLDAREREDNAPTLDLHRELLRLRRTDPVISRQAGEMLDGAVLSERAFLIRWLDPDNDDRLLVVNVGDEVDLTPAPEPLLAPPPGSQWGVVLSTDEVRFGGPGATSPCESNRWRIPAECATLLRAEPVRGP